MSDVCGGWCCTADGGPESADAKLEKLLQLLASNRTCMLKLKRFSTMGIVSEMLVESGRRSAGVTGHGGTLHVCALRSPTVSTAGSVSATDHWRPQPYLSAGLPTGRCIPSSRHRPNHEDQLYPTVGEFDPAIVFGTSSCRASCSAQGQCCALPGRTAGDHS